LDTAYFRFTTRDVLWLTVLVAMAAAWYVNNRMQEAEQARIWREAMEARQEMEQAASAAGYRFVLEQKGLILRPKPSP